MTTFVWFGQKYGGALDNLSGITGAGFGTVDWIDLRHYWGATGNWRIEEVGNTGGWSGGTGGDGFTGDYSYSLATAVPGGGDTVIFKEVNWSNAGSSGEMWPQSECLFGGWSGSDGWVGAATGKTSGYVNIEVHADYFYGGDMNGETMPYGRPMGPFEHGIKRFGEWVGSNASGVARGFQNGGLNLKCGNLDIDSRQVSGTHHGSDFRYFANGTTLGTLHKIKILGSETSVTGDFIATGLGRYVINCNDMNNVFVNGTLFCHDAAYSTNGASHGSGEGSMSLHYTGHISNICRCAGRNIDEFIYTPKWGGTTACPRMDIAPKYLTDQPAAIKIKGAVTTLNFYPYSRIHNSLLHNNGLSGAKYQIASFGSNNAGGRGTWGTIKLYENNPYHSVSITGDGPDTFTNYVSFSNGTTAGATDTINTLDVEAGVFRSGGLFENGVQGTLNILDGVIQGGAYIDLQEKGSQATIEIAGYSGGVAGDGIFVASNNANIILPAAGNIAFNTPSAGSTSAALLGLGGAPGKG